MHPIARVVRDPRFFRGTPARVIVLLIIVNAIVAWRHTALERARRENLLTTTVEQSALRDSARFDRSVGDHLEQYLPAIPDARKERLVLLVGMSQMYSINEYRSG